ncbi:MAG: methyl-accepting chemotaxis protein [Proteobacteria bacterium]|nr:methyl-accepting chemotaxis protein [Pseudomonadota bacterium]MBU1641004.1 methyl-accepting chemotaxis protein [Pseudomonadota bacterium]
MSQERTYKRKILNLSVNRAMQLRMIGKMSSIILVSLLISSGVYYYYANQEITASFQMFHIKAKNFLDFLLPVVGLSFAISLVVGTLASLFFPKNIAGALYRIEQDVTRMAEGDLTVRINLRSGDEGSALAGRINQLVELFSETVVDMQDLVRHTQTINGPGPEMTREESRDEFQEIQDRLTRKMKQFKVAQYH